MPYLSNWRVLRYDGRGQGQSPKPPVDYRLDLLLDDLVRLLDQLDYPPTAVVGISNGGCVAMALAAMHPNRVHALVAADCYHRVTPLLHSKINSWLTAHEVGGATHRFDVATPWIWSERALSAASAKIESYRAKAAEHQDQAVHGLLRGALQHAVDLSDITCPTLLLAGEEDLLTPPFTMRAMAESLPRGRFQTVAGAHASLLEHPEHFAQVIVPFLTEPTAPLGAVGGSHVG